MTLSKLLERGEYFKSRSLKELKLKCAYIATLKLRHVHELIEEEQNVEWNDLVNRYHTFHGSFDNNGTFHEHMPEDQLRSIIIGELVRQGQEGYSTAKLVS